MDRKEYLKQYRERIMEDGRTYQATIQKKWRDRNPDKAKEVRKRHYEKHKKEIQRNARLKWRKNAEKYKNDPEFIKRRRANFDKWYLNHKERHNEHIEIT